MLSFPNVPVRVTFSKSTVFKICRQKLCRFRLNGRPIRRIFHHFQIVPLSCKRSLRYLLVQPVDFFKLQFHNKLFSYAGHYAKVNIVRYHPCASGVLATASYDCDVKIWDVHSGSEIYSLEQHPEPVSTMPPQGHQEVPYPPMIKKPFLYCLLFDCEAIFAITKEATEQGLFIIRGLCGFLGPL